MHGPVPESDKTARMRKCHDELEPDFCKLVRDTRERGWTHLEVCLCLVEMSENCAMGENLHSATDEEIRAHLVRYFSHKPDGES
jgi:hypothetical protein